MLTAERKHRETSSSLPYRAESHFQPRSSSLLIPPEKWVMVLMTTNEWLLGKSECGGFSSQKDSSGVRGIRAWEVSQHKLGLGRLSVLDAWGWWGPENLKEIQDTHFHPIAVPSSHRLSAGDLKIPIGISNRDLWDFIESRHSPRLLISGNGTTFTQVLKSEGRESPSFTLFLSIHIQPKKKNSICRILLTPDVCGFSQQAIL